MKRNRQVLLTHLKKKAVHLEAVSRHEGFRRETDTAFTKFWEREGDSLRNRELIVGEANDNITSRKLLGELCEKPDLNPFILYAYCHSPEARHVSQKYGLIYPYHYNQSLLKSGGVAIISLNNADEFSGVVDGQTVWMFRYPCVQGFRNQSLTHLDIKIDLTWPKEEIMNTFEMVLNDALRAKEQAGEKTKKRGREVDSLPFRVWDMKKEGKTTWQIAQELFPHIKGKSPNEWDENYSASARSHLRKVERALKKANDLIASIIPAS